MIIKTYTMQISLHDGEWRDIEMFMSYPITYRSEAISYGEYCTINIPVKFRAVCDQTGEVSTNFSLGSRK